MNLLIVSSLILIILIVLKIILNIDMITLKEMTKKKDLDELTNKFPENIEICKKICSMIGNTKD